MTMFPEEQHADAADAPETPEPKRFTPFRGFRQGAAPKAESMMYAPEAAPESDEDTDPDSVRIDLVDGKPALYASENTPISALRDAVGIKGPELPTPVADCWDDSLERHLIGRGVREGIEARKLQDISQWIADGIVTRMGGPWPAVIEEFRAWAKGYLSPAQIHGMVDAFRKHGARR